MMTSQEEFEERLLGHRLT